MSRPTSPASHTSEHEQIEERRQQQQEQSTPSSPTRSPTSLDDQSSTLPLDPEETLPSDTDIETSLKADDPQATEPETVDLTETAAHPDSVKPSPETVVNDVQVSEEESALLDDSNQEGPGLMRTKISSSKKTERPMSAHLHSSDLTYEEIEQRSVASSSTLRSSLPVSTEDMPLSTTIPNASSLNEPDPSSKPVSPTTSHLSTDTAFALASKPKGDRTSLLLSNTTKQHSRSSSAEGQALLKEEFDKIRQSYTGHGSPKLYHHRGSSRVSLHGKSPLVGGGNEEDLWDRVKTGAHLDGQVERTDLYSSELAAKDDGEAEEMFDEPLVEDDNGGDVDWAFWGEVMNDYQAVAKEDPARLSQAIQDGIPDVIRGSMWQLMSSSKDSELESLYSNLLHQTSTHEKSIQKDLARTFPTHAFFQRPTSMLERTNSSEDRGRGQDELYNVVRAYSLYDPEVGYVQGSAFIVAALLLNMPDEEAFCVLVRLMHSYGLRTSFLPEMPGLQLRLFQFDRLIEEFIPLLHIHFVRNGIKSSMYAGQWFLTLFSYRFPLPIVYRILDLVFAEGIEAVFRFAIALLLKNEEELLALGFEEILSYLQSKLFDTYRIPPKDDDKEQEEAWNADDFVKDSFAVRITPFQLDGYTAEWQDQCRARDSHAIEVDLLRTANRNLSAQVKQLEASLAQLNTEHCEIVKQVVIHKVEREEMENELVKYKMLYAELSHQSAESRQRSSGSSGTSGFWGLGKTMGRSVSLQSHFFHIPQLIRATHLMIFL
ncbi:related to gyp5-gtpase-activating protein [Phaffia rhodozyma]|uniref:GTPase-activating protein GYP5 n=1 Tax=Phaffia rhodozyma TaxID=264483 RepID=A0A0F7SMD7_PHARH|nr:related to gyp5-gtpase-activating protein [Phaffia rhodozyma]